MTRQEMLDRYAHLLVDLGVALQPGEYLILEGDAESYELIRAVTKRAMEKGARDVLVFLRDAWADKYRARYGAAEEVSAVRPWQTESLDFYLRQGACSLLLESPRPFLMEDVDTDRARSLGTFRNDLRNVIRGHWGKSGTRWCIACAPNREWAKTLYPQLPEEEALDAWWEKLMEICLVDGESDPVENWIAFADGYAKHAQRLNDLDIDYIHFQNGTGTDLRVGFHARARWVGGCERAKRGPLDNMGNIPSNEVATSPDCRRVDGTVHSARPLFYNGALIDGFTLTFRDGRVVEARAQKGQEMLDALLDADEGSRYAGEVAFVEKDRPLARSGMIFYNTLLDENAACHMALGRGYAICIPGLSMTDTDAWAAAHLNHSVQHVDFMFGTDDLCATAYTKNGEAVELFRNGLFV